MFGNRYFVLISIAFALTLLVGVLNMAAAYFAMIAATNPLLGVLGLTFLSPFIVFAALLPTLLPPIPGIEKITATLGNRAPAPNAPPATTVTTVTTTDVETAPPPGAPTPRR